MAEKSLLTIGTGLFAEDGEYSYASEEVAQRLTTDQLVRRRLFAARYVKTANSTDAAAFAGFKSPHTQGPKLVKEPLVAEMIQRLVNALEQDAIVSRNEVLFGLKQEATDFDHGTSSSRVTAWTQLAKVHSMLVDRVDSSVTGNGGVMIVPALGSAEDWEKLAAEQQERLKAEVRD